MNALLLNSISQPFSTADIARWLGISPASARVTAVRYVQRGAIVRLKRDMYIGAGALARQTERSLFAIANHLVVPSYVSLTTALSHYSVTTQQLRGVVESIALKRTRTVQCDGIEFRYMRMRPDLYLGFDRVDGVFIASPEKALADAVYLSSMARYAFDAEALDYTAIRIDLVESFLSLTNEHAKRYWSDVCRTYKLSRRSRSKSLTS